LSSARAWPRHPSRSRTGSAGRWPAESATRMSRTRKDAPTQDTIRLIGSRSPIGRPAINVKIAPQTSAPQAPKTAAVPAPPGKGRDEPERTSSPRTIPARIHVTMLTCGGACGTLTSPAPAEPATAGLPFLCRVRSVPGPRGHLLSRGWLGWRKYRPRSLAERQARGKVQHLAARSRCSRRARASGGRRERSRCTPLRRVPWRLPMQSLDPDGR
jgi:hypothetical protein